MDARTLAGLAALALLVLSCSKAAELPAQPLPANGVADDGTVSYLGIQYARAERWRLPERLAFDADTSVLGGLGPACPQEGLPELTEDCLFLNVFAPETATPKSALPVLVWFHGGGLRAGRGDARQGVLARSDIVVVTFNYRLGALGFHDWEGWPASQARNFGQADMVAALEWVREHISAFGGDPDAVTIGGHSAGGMGVQLMLVDPRAKGLFHRAFSDAGYGTWPFPKAQLHTGDEGNPSVSPDRTTPVEALVARTPYFHLPYVGAADLPEQPINTLRKGAFNRVPVMAGANSYDGRGTLEGAGFSAETFFARYREAPGMEALYADDLAVSEAQASRRLFGDMRYVFAAHELANAASQAGDPAYLFYYDLPMMEHPGTPHGWHYGLALGNPALPFRQYLIAFVKTGTPAVEGLPDWPAFDPDGDQNTMVFRETPIVESGPLAAKIARIATLEFPVRPSLNGPE